MHFVREHHNAVAAADVSDLREFFSRKDLAGRVMRVAEEEKLALRIRGPAFKILKINFPFSIAENERIIGRGAAVLLRDGSERRINRRLHQDFVTRFAERLHSDRKGRAGGRHKVHHALLKIPVIADVAPADSGTLERPFLHVRIAVDPMLSEAFHFIHDRLRAAEIRVRDPHRKDVSRILEPLRAVRSAAVNNLIKVMLERHSYCSKNSISENRFIGRAEGL